ncbi:hypothetical protein N9F34_02340 [Alphaproteobacteria bacterium]|nr:hypothetical protein [Alphaproteobacteria bacterium]
MEFCITPRLVTHELIRVHLVGTSVREQYSFETTGRNYLDFDDECRR